MTEENNNNQKISKKRLYQMLMCNFIAFFWVAFIWNFWNKGVYVLGLNAFVFLMALFILFNWPQIKKKEFFTKRNIIYQLPIFLIILSFLIYENPFIKVIHLLVLPLLFGIFYNYSRLSDNTDKHWDFNFIRHFIKRFFSFFGFFDETVRSYFKILSPKGGNKKNFTKILIGVLILLFVSVVIIIPLLSSADKEFASKINFFYSWITDLISLRFTMKFFVFSLLSVFLLTKMLAWQSSFSFAEKESDKKQLDTIISGIVLGGVLALYLLFLWVQIERLFLGTLPVDFKTTVGLVKSGFWQLIFLSVINIIFFAIYHQKTNSGIQKVLSVFSLASLFLVFSAAQRMFLYVVYYGFSYEKFFAAYAVIFCIIVFVWLIIKLFKKTKIDILKFVMFLFLWMYGLVSIFPIEQFILRTNIKLAQSEDSRIDLYEMTMLSSDVLGIVIERDFDWYWWMSNQADDIQDKKWYEMNLGNYKYLFNNRISQAELKKIKDVVYNNLYNEYHIYSTGEYEQYDVFAKQICGYKIDAKEHKRQLLDKYNLAVSANFERKFISLSLNEFKPLWYNNDKVIVDLVSVLESKTIIPPSVEEDIPVSEKFTRHNIILKKKNGEWQMELDIEYDHRRRECEGGSFVN